MNDIPQRTPVTSYKIVVVGASGVGKTALVNRMVYNKFQSTDSSVGAVSLYLKIKSARDIPFTLKFWDTHKEIKFVIQNTIFSEALNKKIAYNIQKSE